jgi:hypothetical protein
MWAAAVLVMLGGGLAMVANAMLGGFFVGLGLSLFVAGVIRELWSM